VGHSRPSERQQRRLVYGFARKTLTRLTFDAGFDSNPTGLPTIVGSSRVGSEGHRDIYRKNSSGTGGEELLLESPAQRSPSAGRTTEGRSCSSFGDHRRVATTAGDLVL